ncbi:leucine-rich repeat protein [Allomuricauda sp. R78024]|uniref:leucine-rich repeat domain-containing protein n=1 Tax=Allomuricauda sp. R78024 TaxID=3093867 RepID=UPI0037CAB494
MKKQLQLIVSTILMVLAGLIGYGQQLGDVFTYDNVTYRVTKLVLNKEVTIQSSTNTGGALTMPETVTYQGNNFSVTVIGPHAFKDKALTSVRIPNSIKIIGTDAFRNTTLESVTIPENVTLIATGAFKDNPLTSVLVLANVPPSLPANDTFSNLGIIEVVVPVGNKTTYESNPAWGNRYAFKDITQFGVGTAFTGNGIGYRITSVNPGKVAVTGRTGSSTDTDITIPGTVFYGQDCAVTSIGNSAFENNDLTDVTLPNSVTSIGNSAFSGNQLTSVIIPEGLTSIKENAFANNLLATVVLERTDPPSIQTNTFGNHNQIDVFVPKGALDNYTPAWDSFNFKSITEVLEINESFTVEGITYKVTGLGSTNTVTITDNTNTGDLIIPGTITRGGNDFNVTGIEDEAFTFNQLTRVTIPVGVTSIGANAFNGNLNLATVVLEAADPPSIEENTFGNRNQIDVVVPRGALGSYQNHAEWVGFKSITEELEINDAFTVQGITYKVTALGSPNTVTIIDNTNTGDLTIPGSVPYGPNGFEVTRIGDDAFDSNQLTSVILPNSVTHIGDYAFFKNQLSSVTLPNSVTRIGDNAFMHNQLTIVTLPNSVTHIGDNAFSHNQLTSVTLPNSMTSIGGGIFENNQLTSVTIPSSVTSIGNSAFANNPLATVVSERANPPSIQTSSFGNRNQIDVIVPKGVPAGSAKTAYETNWGMDFKSITEVLEINDTFTVEGITYKVTGLGSTKTVTITNNTNTGNLTIPGTISRGGNDFSVTGIGDEAFVFNQLTHVTIPDGVASIGANAFNGNPDLAIVVLEAADPPSIQTNTFGNRDQIDVVVPKGTPAGSIKTAYETDWGTDFKSITEELEINDSFTVQGITYKITALGSLNTVRVEGYEGTATSINILQTITYGPNDFEVISIGDGAFENSDLTSVTIPNSVATIGERAFLNNQLSNVTIPEGVSSIGNGAFEGNALTSVTLPNSVTSIKDYVFAGNQLTEVTIPGNVTSIGGWAFAVNPDLVTLIVEPSNPPTLHEDAFRDLINNIDFRHQIDVFVPKGKRQVYLDHGWTGFKSIKEVVELGDTFSVDNITYKITEIVPDKEVAVIGYSVTGGGMIIPPTVDHVPNTNTYTVTSIGESAFFGRQLTSVVIPNTVISIGEDAFWKNQLTSVVIPESVTSIGQRAFGTNQLDSVTIPDGVTSIGQWVFAANQLTEVTIPASVESIGYQAFYDNPNLGLVRVERNDPPALDPNAFQGTHSDLRHQIDLVVPKDKRQDYINAGWTDFRSITEVVERGDTFIVGSIVYKITSLNPYKVEAGDYYFTSSSLTIPTTVDHGLNTYTVTSIGGFSSVGAPAFVSLVRVEADNPPMLHPTSFQGTGRSQIDVIVPEGTKEAYLAAEWTGFRSITEPYDAGNTFTKGSYTYLITSSNPQTVKAIDYTGTATHVNIPEIVNTVNGLFTVTAIGNEVFKDKGLTSVAIPNSVTSIGDHAFSGNQLTEVTIPDGVTSIGEWAFDNNRLTEVIIPNNVTSIGYRAFSVNELTRVTIGNSITSIGEYAFAVNQDLVIVVMKATVPPSFHENAFFVPFTYKKINLIVPLGTVDAYSAAGWTTFVASITTDPPQGFTVDNIYYEVTSLNPNKVKVPPYNYYNITGAMTIPPTVDYFGLHTYTVTAIASRAFYNHGLTSVTIPDSVTSIEEGAFENNPNLETVTVKATDPPSLHADAFQNADRNQIDLIVPIGKRQEYLDNGWHGFRSITEAAMAAQSAVVQGTSAKASHVENAVALAHGAKGNVRNNVSVYPNPAQDYINIALGDGEALQQVNIYNAQGAHVHSARALQIDVSHLPSGMYMLEIETKAGERVVKRVMIQ